MPSGCEGRVCRSSCGLRTVRAGLVEALAGWFDKHAWVQGGGRESPGMRVTFFRVAERKSPKKGRPPVCDPFAVRRGNLRRGGCGVRRRTHCAPAALRSDNCGESDHEAWALRRPCHPTTAPPQAQPAGGGQPNSRTATRAIAALGPTCAARGACAREMGPSEAMARVDVRWVPFTMRRGAQGVGRHGRRSARASCSDSLRLSERSAQRVASSAARPTHEHRRLPAAKRRDAACRVALSLVTFFRRRERKLLACRATPGLRPQTRHTAEISERA